MHIAQVNVTRAVTRLDSPRLQGFADLYGPLDELARASPGFVWRPGPSELDVRELAVFGDLSRVVPNFSVWESIEALRDYVYSSAHREALRRRAEWFLRPTAASAALWWVPAGERPSCAEAHRRLQLLRTEGPTAQAFPLSAPYPPQL
jgi:uncharacterized protein DUF3291